jgi:hypothetical protein
MQSDTAVWMGGAGAAVALTQNTAKIFATDLKPICNIKRVMTKVFG